MAASRQLSFLPPSFARLDLYPVAQSLALNYGFSPSHLITRRIMAPLRTSLSFRGSIRGSWVVKFAPASFSLCINNPDPVGSKFPFLGPPSFDPPGVEDQSVHRKIVRRSRDPSQPLAVISLSASVSQGHHFWDEYFFSRLSRGSEETVGLKSPLTI